MGGGEGWGGVIFFLVPLRTVKSVFSDVLSIFSEGGEIYLSAPDQRLPLADTSAAPGFSGLMGCFYLEIFF